MVSFKIRMSSSTEIALFVLLLSAVLLVRTVDTLLGRRSAVGLLRFNGTRNDHRVFVKPYFTFYRNVMVPANTQGTTLSKCQCVFAPILIHSWLSYRFFACITPPFALFGLPVARHRIVLYFQALSVFSECTVWTDALSWMRNVPP